VSHQAELGVVRDSDRLAPRPASMPLHAREHNMLFGQAFRVEPGNLFRYVRGQCTCYLSLFAVHILTLSLF
jgi:hypothetical protein